MHTLKMQTVKLLQELLYRAKLNANGLVSHLHEEGVTQASLSRFMSGKTKEPRRTTMLPVANFFGINIESFYNEELAEQLLQQLQSGAIKLGRPANRHTATPTTNTETAALKQKLKDWRMTASPRSAQVIDQLTLLAEKNALREDDWTLIEQMARRMKTPD